MQMVSWPVLSLKIGQLYSNTDRENDPTNLDINFYSFSNSLETKSAKASSGERQYPLTSTLIASKLQSGTTRWASAGLPKSWNSSGKSHLAASCFYSFQPFISEHSVLLKLPLASQRYMYLFVNKFSLCLISNPNNFYNISFPLYALMAWTLIFRSTLSPSQTWLKPDGQGMPKMFILQMLKYRVF